MNKPWLAIGGLLLATTVSTVALVADTDAAQGGATIIPFKDARLKIEYNATDGDAGIQVFIDAEPWREIEIITPAGKLLTSFEAERVIQNYGLTELFSESSEPSFDEFPFSEFKKLFPEGTYTFRGRTIEGQRLRSSFVLSHKVPDGPNILAPADGATVPQAALYVDWAPVTTPAGVTIVAYEVLVVADAPALGNPKRVFDVLLSGATTDVVVPAQFLTPGTYKVEVLAIEASGNQTLIEHAFTVQ